MTNRIFRSGMFLFVTVFVHSYGYAQQNVDFQRSLPPLPPVPALPPSPPTQLPDPLPPADKIETISPETIIATQPPIPDTPPSKNEAPQRVVQPIKEPGDRFRKPEGQPGFPEAAYGNGHWCWTGWKYGPRIAPTWEYPGLGGGPSVTYPWGMPGYTCLNGEKSLDKVCRLWGPPVPVYTPVPQPDNPKKLINPLRNVSSPGFIYGWVGPFPASPRYKHYAVDVWSQPNVDLSTGRPRSEQEKQLNKPAGTGDSRSPIGDGDTKKSVGYMTLAMKVPTPGAEVYVEGVKTMQSGTDRTFHSPELEPGTLFRYEVTVRWLERGSIYEIKKVVFGATGDVIPMDFTTSEVVRAGR